jgi:hypothetical protein
VAQLEHGTSTYLSKTSGVSRERERDAEISVKGEQVSEGLELFESRVAILFAVCCRLVSSMTSNGVPNRGFRSVPIEESWLAWNI